MLKIIIITNSCNKIGHAEIKLMYLYGVLQQKGSERLYFCDG